MVALTDEFAFGVPDMVQFTFTMSLITIPFAIVVGILAMRHWLSGERTRQTPLQYIWTRECVICHSVVVLESLKFLSVDKWSHKINY